ncbi:hypothetical protein [Actinoplanes regularis]|uniref:hypothetical protein n=1 Tax=Actinoplanes regularis TaxID=52697 RepID=UPI0011780A48|nr:hypothetical protein [Actinoplanes regularis]
MNEIAQVDQRIATTTGHQAEKQRNLQLAQRTARASCRPVSLFPVPDIEHGTYFRPVTGKETSFHHP